MDSADTKKIVAALHEIAINLNLLDRTMQNLVEEAREMKWLAIDDHSMRMRIFVRDMARDPKKE